MTSEDHKEPDEFGQAMPGDGAFSDEPGTTELGERLAEAEREIEQFKKLAQRSQADLVNYRNRVRTEQESLQARTTERVASRFIEVADQFEKALAPASVSNVDPQWVAGVQGIYQNLINVLKAEGFERFDAHGEEFDPRRHEALLASPTTEHPPNHVMHQITAGYTKNGEVVRPAQVEIASAPGQEN